MTDTKRCGATHPKQPETCNRDPGHVGMHMNRGNLTWKQAKPEATKEPSLTDKCPKCERELGEHDGKKCPPKAIDVVFGTTNGEVPPKSKARKVHKDEPDPVEERAYALIVAEPGIPMEQVDARHKKAVIRLEAAGRIELLRGGWVPTGPLGVEFDAQWKRLAELGACDELGGLEYERVRAEFFAAGSPSPIEPFIRRRANAGPDGKDAPIPGEEAAVLTSSLKVHPAADALPMIEGAEFDALVEDMRVNGQRTKIVVDHAAEWLVDGRNRRRAGEILGITLQYERLPEGTDIAAYVISTNLKRRHLTESQRAMIASRIANLSQGQHKTRPGGGFEKKVTQAEAAKMSGVGERTVQRANAVSDKAVPELVDAVVAGKVDLKGAEQVAKLSPSQQRQLLKERVDTSKGPVRAGKLAAVARQEKKRETVRNINSGKVRPMPAGQFGVIYVDYPWKYDNSDQHEGSRGHAGYPQMPIEDIIAHAREAAKRAAKDCVIALWVTNAYIQHVGRFVEAYGATQHTMYTWPKPNIGVGTWGRGQTEHLVIASIGAPVHTLNEVSTLLPSYELREHSRKPDEVAQLLLKHCSGPHLELFSQVEREGWTTWGAETGKYDGKAA